MTAGIPDGWRERERVDLREGAWRFYRAVDPTFSSSVSEQNVVVRGKQRQTGERGLAALLADMGAWEGDLDDAARRRLAEQVGHLVIEATSRSSGRVVLDDTAPVTLVVDGRVLAMTMTFRRDGAPTLVRIVAERDGATTVHQG
jgi:hypothetical protein